MAEYKLSLKVIFDDAFRDSADSYYKELSSFGMPHDICMSYIKKMIGYNFGIDKKSVIFYMK